MRRITMWLLSTIVGVVLLFSYRTSTIGAAAPASPGAGSDPGAATTTGGTAAGAGSDPGTGSTSGSGSGSRTGSGSGSSSYQGSVAQTRWGPVQVSITVTNGKITSVSVPTYPNENGRDRQINARALPILKKETLSAQNANIDAVSGATVTSDGYRESLQAALDAAHLG